MHSLPITDSRIVLAPYVWKCTGTDSSSRAEATMPGAYLRALVKGTATVDLLVDGTANVGCPTTAMPIVDLSIDGGAFRSVQLSANEAVYRLPVADGLDTAEPHRVEVFFRAAALAYARWSASTTHLRIAGLELEASGSLLPCPRHPGNAIAFGDSITEGVCVEGVCPFYTDLPKNNARVTWAPLVCSALLCEYGQLGTGGQGMVRPIEMPPLPQTWDHYDAATSRLTGGLLLPEPDLALCCMGTNDYDTKSGSPAGMDITAEYTRWLAAVRVAAARAAIFCIAPPLGWHAAEIAAAAKARVAAGDANVYFVDAAVLKDRFATRGATQLSVDGVHPSVYGNAVLGALIAAEVSGRLHPRRQREDGQ